MDLYSLSNVVLLERLYSWKEEPIRLAQRTELFG